MRYFYVDYENVQSIGLDGLTELTEQDKVTILYSAHADTMKIDIVKQIQNAKAEVKFIEVDTGTMNALDFQLIALLFMELNIEDEYLIVSKDTGFDAAIKMAKRRDYSNVRRIPSIQSETEMEILIPEDKSIGEELLFMIHEQEVVNSAESDKKEEKLNVTPRAQIDNIIIDKCGSNACKKYGDLIITGLKASGNKNQFYQFFRKNLGDIEGGDLYRSIRTKFDDMKALL